MITKDDFTRINNDGNGNPRYVIHFLKCLPQHIIHDNTFAIGEKYLFTVKLMNKIGGRKYHNKSYGGGIVFQSYSLDETIEHIEKIKGEMK